MKNIICAFILFFISKAFAGYDISNEVNKLNEKYNSYSPYPIVVFDKKLLSNKIAGRPKKEQLLIVEEYVESQIDVDVTKNDADALLDYLTVLNGSAVALPFISYETYKNKFCAVLPAYLPNISTAEQEMERALGISPGINPYVKAGAKDIAKQFTLKELSLYSLYHELSHCLNSEILPKYTDQSPSTIHMNESFAESLALLLLAKEKNMFRMGLKRSLMRSLYSKYMGKYLATSPDVISINPNIRYGGSIYYLSPAIAAAQRYIQENTSKIKTMTTDQLVAVADFIISTNTLESRDIAAMHAYQIEGPEIVLERYKGLAKKVPSLLYTTYMNLLQYDIMIKNIDDLILAL